MSFKIVLLVTVTLGTSNAMRFEPCELEYLHKCDESFVADFATHPKDPDMGVYCNTFQVRTGQTVTQVDAS